MHNNRLCPGQVNRSRRAVLHTVKLACAADAVLPREYYTYLIRRGSVYTSGTLGASISFVGCLLRGGMNIIDMFLAVFLGTLWISPSAEGLSLGLSNMVNC